MPVTPTYPGVYIEEVPSGVRTIMGVATSIAAFLGRAPRGPENKAITITNFGDFERIFGGLNADYPMSYTVRDFYANGGTQAIIVRLFKSGAQEAAQDVAKAAKDSNGPAPGDVADAAEARAKDYESEPGKSAAAGVAKAARNAVNNEKTREQVLKAAQTKAAKTPVMEVSQLEVNNNCSLRAISAGSWGNNLSVKIDHKGIDAEVVKRFGLVADFWFNLSVVENPPNQPAERFLVVSLHSDAGARRLDRVLQAESNLVRLESDIPEVAAADRPGETPEEQDPTNNKAEKIKKFEGGYDSISLDSNTFIGSRSARTGLYALEGADLFNLLCIPPDNRTEDTDKDVYSAALEYCYERRAMLIVDPPNAWKNRENLLSEPDQMLTDGIGLNGLPARNAVLYYPRVRMADPKSDGQVDTFAPCGIIAGVMARTDVTRGVWKAPAGLDAGLNGVRGLEVELTDRENGILNPLGINCLRSFPITGRVVWGARTLRGADQLADEYKYVPIRRLALFIEETLYRGTKWVVFEPNDEPLWAQIRLNVGVFMHTLFRQGAFQGSTPQQAYFVKCDKETNPQADIDRGIVNILVGFAPLKPAEFVIIKLQQIAGDLQV